MYKEAAWPCLQAFPNAGIIDVIHVHCYTLYIIFVQENDLISMS